MVSNNYVCLKKIYIVWTYKTDKFINEEKRLAHFEAKYSFY